jgi:hypothetical protein
MKCLEVKMSKILFKTDMSSGGTSCQGYVDTSYAKLVETFGEPTPGWDDYKTDAEWVLATVNGYVVTIYNYKDGKNYLGEEGLPVEEIRDWHIGGAGPHAVDLVQEALPTEKTTKGW